MKRITTVLVFLLACLAAAAQEVTLTVDAPESAVAGERFRIIYTINSTDGQFTRPKFDPSFSVQGPQQSTNRNVQWINGDMKVVSSTTSLSSPTRRVSSSWKATYSPSAVTRISVSIP